MPPHPLLEHLDEVKQALMAAPQILLVLDFDGTIAPIVETPELAKLPEATRSVLDLLNREPGVTLAIISGRALADVKRRVGIDLIYAGNHGLEIEGPGMSFRYPGLAKTEPILDKIAVDLAEGLKSIRGVLIENKRSSLSIHFRQVDDSKIPLVLKAVESACIPSEDSVELHGGKKVLEVRPKVDWNKGKAVEWILRQVGAEGTLPICIGDDKTDEDMFRALPSSVSIKVGSEPTTARYRVSDPDEVRFILYEILGQIRQ
jgi:trehalose 6-phosphate phosphatase